VSSTGYVNSTMKNSQVTDSSMRPYGIAVLQPSSASHLDNQDPNLLRSGAIDSCYTST